MRELTEHEISGKTLKKVIFYNDQAVLLFDDETFIMIVGKENYHDVELEFQPLDIYEFSNDLLVENGIYTQERLDNIKNKWCNHPLLVLF